MAPVVTAAVVVALAAAVRSTWSPCGLSMLSTITPLTERSRGHRYRATATWFVVGAVAGGLTLGAVAALGAAAVAALDVSATVAVAVGSGLAVLAGAVDLGSLGIRPPFLRRQVDDHWLDAYRPWVYGTGFGWQIGVGVTTYIMTAGVLLTIALAVLSGSPPVALAIGAGFGLARGLPVFASTRATTPVALRSLHARFDTLEGPVRLTAAAVQLAVGLALAVVVAPVAGLAAAAVTVAAVARAAPRSRLRRTPVDS